LDLSGADTKPADVQNPVITLYGSNSVKAKVVITSVA